MFAHVTPSYDDQRNIIGYHSNRRRPTPEAIATIEPIYRQLLEVEEKHENKKDGMMAAFGVLVGMLNEAGMEYDEFVFSL